jgi:RNA polymerase sigma-70 factor (ECF subfamily)
MEPAKLKELYDKHYFFVFNLSRKLIKDSDIAKDMAQETFLRVYRAMKPDASNERAYLAMTTKSVCFDYIRDQKKTLRLHKEFGYLSSEEDINNAMIEAAVIEDLYKVINVLPEKQRQIVNLKVFENLSHSQIGYNLGITERNSIRGLEQAIAGIKRRLRLLFPDLRLREISSQRIQLNPATKNNKY